MSIANRLVYIRHGETEWSRTGRHTGTTDVPLTPTGVEQATALRPVLDALDLRPAAVWTSPRARAVHTAELAGLTPTAVDTDLVEWDYGDYEGRTSADIRASDPGWTVWPAGAPGGETPVQVSARADAVLGRARTTLTDGDVVLVAHGHVGRVLAARFLGLSADFGRHLPLLPASANVFGFDGDGTAQVLQFGLTGYDAARYAGR